MKKIFAILLVLCFAICISFNKEVKVSGLADTDLFSVQTTRDFRAVWISPLVNDLSRYTNKTSYQNQILSIIETMEYFNFNVMIFHVRIYNDAIYKSNYNAWSSYYSTNPDWDPLPWVIEECHKRGIEFHAWMNPYRVSTGSKSSNLSTIASRFPKANPASDPANLIAGSGTIILNPGLSNVRAFLVRTCMELTENYDIDAIHFDDYFYVEDIGDADMSTYYENSGGLSLENWRREQVNIFIKDLHDSLTRYNAENNRSVQLGISPTPVYDDGDGVVTYDENGTAITTGSLTSYGGHYDDYHFVDTKKWIDNEWIDYFVPQCYHGVSLERSEFKPAIDWWSKVVKHKDVNLYIGIGLYRAGGSNADWADDDEFLNEMNYINDFEDVQGISIFSYRHLQNAYRNATSIYAKQVDKVKHMWEEVAFPPIVKGIDNDVTEAGEVKLQKVNNGYKLAIKKQEGIKWYAIYRSTGDFTYDASDFVALTGYETNDYVEYIDEVTGNYKYSVVPLTYSNVATKPINVDTSVMSHKVTFYDSENNTIDIQYVIEGQSAIAPDYTIAGYSYTWVEDFSNITADKNIHMNITPLKYKVEFLGPNGEVVATEMVDYNSFVNEVTDVTVEGYKFVSWSFKFTTPITQDIQIQGTYTKNRYYVLFYVNRTHIQSIQVYHGDPVTPPNVTAPEGYIFKGWDADLTSIKEAISINAILEPIKYSVKLMVDNVLYLDLEVNHGSKLVLPEVEGYTIEVIDSVGDTITSDLVLNCRLVKNTYTVKLLVDTEIIDTQTVEYGDNVVFPADPQKAGYTFAGWDNDGRNVTTDLSITATFNINTYKVTFVVDGVVVSEQTVEYGMSATLPVNPPKAGYTFAGWSNSTSNIVSDVEAVALFTANTYTLTLQNSKNEVIATGEILFGDTITDEDIKEVAASVKYADYKVISGNIQSVDGDVVIQLITASNCQNFLSSVYFAVISAAGMLFFVIRRKLKV